MQSRNSYFKDIIKIAAPIIMGNLGFIMIGVCDVIVAGRHSTNTLAGISIATAITNCIMMFGIGILVNICPILSNYRGAGKDTKKYFYPSLRFSMFLSLIISAIILLTIPLIDKIGYEAELSKIIKDYLFITSFTAFGAYLHCMTKEFLQSFEIVIFPNIVTIFSIFLNLFLNIILVFGAWKIPSMGAIGLAIASLITRYFMGIVLLIYCFYLGKVSAENKDKKVNRCFYKDLIKVGLPASLAIMIEFVAFNSISVIMGRVAGIYAAAHNLLCTMTSVSFMVPLAISNAVAIKVGYNNGAKDFFTLKKYAYTGLKTNTIFMACSAIIIALFANFWVSLFTKDIALINICVPIVYLLACFQIFDGLQVTLSGIFRGIKHTKTVMVSNLISYWFLAFPLGVVLAFKFHLNLVGFWIAIGIASVVLCTMMFLLLQRKLKRMVAAK